MKILITTGIFKPELGGPATFAAEFASRLKAAGHAVEVITYSDKLRFSGDGTCSFPVVRIVRRKNKLLNYLAYFLMVYREAKHFDFIYSLDWFSAGVPVMLASRLRRKRYIVRVGGGYIWEKYLSEGRPPMTLKRFYEQNIHKEYRVMFFLIQQVLNRAAHVIFNSDEQRLLYARYYNLDPQRISTIYNAVPEHKFGNLIQSYKLRSADRDREIVYAGRFIKMKNVESLILAFARLNDTSFTLLLIGTGPTKSELEALARELGIETRVKFLPPMSSADLYRRIANCYVVVIPSWTDVSPHQVYECLSLGIPFLLTKENYLNINSKDFLKIDPASVEDIAEKLNNLLDDEYYSKFTDALDKLRFRRSWNNVLTDHMNIFKLLA